MAYQGESWARLMFLGHIFLLVRKAFNFEDHLCPDPQVSFHLACKIWLDPEDYELLPWEAGVERY